MPREYGSAVLNHSFHICNEELPLKAVCQKKLKTRPANYFLLTRPIKDYHETFTSKLEAMTLCKFEIIVI